MKYPLVRFGVYCLILLGVAYGFASLTGGTFDMSQWSKGTKDVLSGGLPTAFMFLGMYVFYWGDED